MDSFAPWKMNGSGMEKKEREETPLQGEDESNSGNKSEALRQASLRLLKDPRYRHPFYWAGFVLVGRN